MVLRRGSHGLFASIKTVISSVRRENGLEEKKHEEQNKERNEKGNKEGNEWKHD